MIYIYIYIKKPAPPFAGESLVSTCFNSVSMGTTGHFFFLELVSTEALISSNVP